MEGMFPEDVCTEGSPDDGLSSHGAMVPRELEG